MDTKSDLLDGNNCGDKSSIDLVDRQGVMDSENGSDPAKKTFITDMKQVSTWKGNTHPCEGHQAVLEKKLRKVSESYEREKLLRIRLSQERDILQDHLVYIMRLLAEEDSSFLEYLKIRDKLNEVLRSGSKAIKDLRINNDVVICAEDSNSEDFVNFLNSPSGFTRNQPPLPGQKSSEPPKITRVNGLSCSDNSDKEQSFGAVLPEEANRVDRPPTILGKVPILQDVPIRLLMGAEYVQSTRKTGFGKSCRRSSSRNRYNFPNIAKAFGISYEDMTDDQRLAFRNAICQRYSREYRRIRKLQQMNAENREENK